MDEERPLLPFNPGTAALLALVRKFTTDRVLDGLRGDGGTVLKTSLDHTKEAALQVALAGVQAMIPASPADLAKPFSAESNELKSVAFCQIIFPSRICLKLQTSRLIKTPQGGTRQSPSLNELPSEVVAKADFTLLNRRFSLAVPTHQNHLRRRARRRRPRCGRGSIAATTATAAPHDQRGWIRSNCATSSLCDVELGYACAAANVGRGRRTSSANRSDRESYRGDGDADCYHGMSPG